MPLWSLGSQHIDFTEEIGVGKPRMRSEEPNPQKKRLVTATVESHFWWKVWFGGGMCFNIEIIYHHQIKAEKMLNIISSDQALKA